MPTYYKTSILATIFAFTLIGIWIVIQNPFAHLEAWLGLFGGGLLGAILGILRRRYNLFWPKSE